MTTDICSKNHGGNAQSTAANAKTNKKRDAARILALLEAVGASTCDDVETALGMSHQTCSARFSELKRAGLIEPTGKRKTRTGCPATAWGVVKKVEVES